MHPNYQLLTQHSEKIKPVTLAIITCMLRLSEVSQSVNQ